MLETVRASIIEADNCLPFEEFFNSHVMSVQDDNIITEIRYNIRRNNSSILDIERLAQDQHERLVKSS